MLPSDEPPAAVSVASQATTSQALTMTVAPCQTNGCPDGRSRGHGQRRKRPFSRAPVRNSFHQEKCPHRGAGGAAFLDTGTSPYSSRYATLVLRERGLLSSRNRAGSKGRATSSHDGAVKRRAPAAVLGLVRAVARSILDAAL